MDTPERYTEALRMAQIDSPIVAGIYALVRRNRWARLYGFPRSWSRADDEGAGKHRLIRELFR